MRRIDERRCPECGCRPHVIFADRAERRHRRRRIARVVGFWGGLAMVVALIWAMSYLQVNADELSQKKGFRLLYGWR
jgi:type VI protein secretion system component VasF